VDEVALRALVGPEARRLDCSAVRSVDRSPPSRRTSSASAIGPGAAERQRRRAADLRGAPEQEGLGVAHQAVHQERRCRPPLAFAQALRERLRDRARRRVARRRGQADRGPEPDPGVHRRARRLGGERGAEQRIRLLRRGLLVAGEQHLVGRRRHRHGGRRALRRGLVRRRRRPTGEARRGGVERVVHGDVHDRHAPPVRGAPAERSAARLQEPTGVPAAEGGGAASPPWRSICADAGGASSASRSSVRMIMDGPRGAGGRRDWSGGRYHRGANAVHAGRGTPARRSARGGGRGFGRHGRAGSPARTHGGFRRPARRRAGGRSGGPSLPG
jgi:hypothetical protein